MSEQQFPQPPEEPTPPSPSPWGNVEPLGPVGSSYPPSPPPPPAYGGYGVPSYGASPNPHPQATTVLVLGILSFLCCQLLAPFAWYMGAQARREVAANPAAYSPNQGTLTAGWILGIIGTCFLIFAVVVYGLMFMVSLGSS